jgi:hypothetical protein
MISRNLVNKRAVKREGDIWYYLDLTRINEPFPISNKFFDLLKAVEELPSRMHLQQSI